MKGGSLGIGVRQRHRCKVQVSTWQQRREAASNPVHCCNGDGALQGLRQPQLGASLEALLPLPNPAPLPPSNKQKLFQLLRWADILPNSAFIMH